MKKWRVHCDYYDCDWRWWGLGLAVYFLRHAPRGSFSVELHLGPLSKGVSVERRVA